MDRFDFHRNEKREAEGRRARGEGRRSPIDDRRSKPPQEETRNRGLSGKRGHTVSWVFANIFSLFLISHKIIAEEVVDEKAKHVGDQFGEALCRFVPLCAALCRFVPLCAALCRFAAAGS